MSTLFETGFSTSTLTATAETIIYKVTGGGEENKENVSYFTGRFIIDYTKRYALSLF